jgi:hypothetical protein
MQGPKVQLSNVSRIKDIKNTSNSSRQKDTHKPNKQKVHYQHQQQIAPVYPKLIEVEIKALRNALTEAINENDVLRDRVVELEALVVEAQTQIELRDEQ